MSTKLVLPRPTEKYDPRAESQRNQLIEQAVSRAGGGTVAAPPAWGDITGTLSDQADLQSALDALEVAASRGWAVVTAGQALVANAPPVLAFIATTQNFPLPTSPTAGDRFVVGNARGSTAGALVRVQTDAGQQIIGTAAAGDDVTVAPGETIYLVARSATLLEIV